MRKRTPALLLAALLVLGAACGGGDDSAHTVVAKGIRFDPTTVTVDAGTPATLTLDNQDPEVRHSLLVEAGGERFTTGVFPGPDSRSVEVTMDEPGMYTYVCEVHPSMEGDLVVE